MTKEKPSKLESALDKINKTYGKGTIQKFKDAPLKDIECVSSGSISLDVALGVGGYPKGRIIEVFGIESGGKSTIALHAVAEVQKLGGTAAFLDVEHALDMKYAKALGVDVDNLVITQPDFGEEALDIAQELIQTGEIDILVVDSVAALVPKAELEGEAGDMKMGLQARLMSQALRKLTGIVSKTGCICIFINQLRQKIGVVFGNPDVTTGGNALKYYASIRLDVRRTGQNKDKDVVVSNRTKVKVVKNKVAPPYRTAEFDIVFGIGIDRNAEILDLATDTDVVNKSGAWYSFNETKLGQGREAVLELMRDNPELAEEIYSRVVNNTYEK